MLKLPEISSRLQRGPHMLLEIQTEASAVHVDSNDSYRVRHV
jgi:hypothetical protein